MELGHRVEHLAAGDRQKAVAPLRDVEGQPVLRGELDSQPLPERLRFRSQVERDIEHRTRRAAHSFPSSCVADW
jgi:hypothetical protein